MGMSLCRCRTPSSRPAEPPGRMTLLSLRWVRACPHPLGSAVGDTGAGVDRDETRACGWTGSRGWRKSGTGCYHWPTTTAPTSPIGSWHHCSVSRPPGRAGRPATPTSTGARAGSVAGGGQLGRRRRVARVGVSRLGGGHDRDRGRADLGTGLIVCTAVEPTAPLLNGGREDHPNADTSVFCLPESDLPQHPSGPAAGSRDARTVEIRATRMSGYRGVLPESVRAEARPRPCAAARPGRVRSPPWVVPAGGNARCPEW